MIEIDQREESQASKEKTRNDKGVGIFETNEGARSNLRNLSVERERKREKERKREREGSRHKSNDPLQFRGVAAPFFPRVPSISRVFLHDGLDRRGLLRCKLNDGSIKLRPKLSIHARFPIRTDSTLKLKRKSGW